MQLTDQQVIDLFSRLARIEEKLEAGPAHCENHTTRLDDLTKRVDNIDTKLGKVETVIGKKELLVALFGAIGIGFGFFVRFLWAKVTS